MKQQLKEFLERLLPMSLLRHLINAFHFVEAIAANMLYGFPARNMKFVGVTGTNGKTTTSVLIAEILREAGYTVGLNSTAVIRVGDVVRENDLSLTTAGPFQLQKLLRQMKNAGCEWVVMEVSSHALIQHRVLGIQFDTTVFTNLTQEHLDYHRTMEEYAQAKGRLFAKFPRVSVLNRDDKWYEFFAKYRAEQQISFGTDSAAECRITQAKLATNGTKLHLKLDEYEIDLKLNMPGKFNAYNALTAASTAYAMNVSLDHIKHGLEHVKGVPGRMEVIDEGQDFVVLVDFAHTADALENVLRTIRTTLKGRLITVTGSAGERDRTKREPMGKVAAELSEVVIVTDDEPHAEDPAVIREAILKGTNQVDYGVVVREIPDRKEAMLQALRYAKKGDVVLFAGMGAQPYRVMADGKYQWDEREVARELLTEL